MTQERLAELTEMEASSLSLLERGERGYTQDSLERIARALRVTPGELTDVDPSKDSALWAIWETLTGTQRRTAIDLLRALKPHS